MGFGPRHGNGVVFRKILHHLQVQRTILNRRHFVVYNITHSHSRFTRRAVGTSNMHVRHTIITCCWYIRTQCDNMFTSHSDGCPARSNVRVIFVSNRVGDHVKTWRQSSRRVFTPTGTQCSEPAACVFYATLKPNKLYATIRIRIKDILYETYPSRNSFSVVPLRNVRKLHLRLNWHSCLADTWCSIPSDTSTFKITFCRLVPIHYAHKIVYLQSSESFWEHTTVVHRPNGRCCNTACFVKGFRECTLCHNRKSPLSICCSGQQNFFSFKNT